MALKSLFWLIPPSMRANSAEEYYLSFTRRQRSRSVATRSVMWSESPVRMELATSRGPALRSARDGRRA